MLSFHVTVWYCRVPHVPQVGDLLEQRRVGSIKKDVFHVFTYTLFIFALQVGDLLEQVTALGLAAPAAQAAGATA